MSDIVIKVENLGKKYIISHQTDQRYVTLRDVIANKAKQAAKLLNPNHYRNSNHIDPSIEEFWALKDINFEVNQGDRIGIIGRNGAGKSTLLKILSRITEPTTGSVKIKGRVASLLEVGTGFHPELTGRENIYLNGGILGMSRIEIRKKFDEIVDFAEVEKFLDTPVKRYSSGMYVRLAFAVAAHLEPEILVVDEVLSVGDAEFQKKCLGKMEDVSKNEGRTVLFVSHDLGAVNKLCDKTILLKDGILENIDYTSKIISQYLKISVVTSQKYFSKNADGKKIYFMEIFLTDINGNVKNEFIHDEEICINFELVISEIDKNANVFLMVLDKWKRRIFGTESNGIKNKMKLIIKPKFFVRGNYSIHTFIHIPRITQIDVAEDVCQFSIIDTG